MCLKLATALHSIAVGNLAARVGTVCVDMSESLPVKLSNRGSMQAIGLVTDVGFSLDRLAEAIESLRSLEIAHDVQDTLTLPHHRDLAGGST